MPAKKYRVKLTAQERQELKDLVSKGKTAARRQVHARILLLSDENNEAGTKTDGDIARVLSAGKRTVERVRQRFVEEGLDSALNPKPQLNRKSRKLDGEAEAFLIATACSKAPEGRTYWTMQLLADKLVECDIIDSISCETVRKVLKKTNSSPG